jgi:peptidyl-tRNA hydrolase
MCSMASEIEEPSSSGDPAPWALPIVVRAERDAEPTAAAAIEATAMAVVRLLDDPRSTSGEWADAVQSWLDGRVRKVARRARGARWETVSALPGVTVDWAGAQVRAMLPTPTDAVPPEIGKLQVAGLDLTPGEPSLPAPGRLPLALTPLVAMSPLKSAVQAAHAAQFARTTMSARELEGWRSTGFEVRLVRPDAATWNQLLATARVTIHDGGFTEVAPGTLTAIALWGDSVA